MGRSCTELWTNVHYVLKMMVLSCLLAVNYFVLDSYSKFHEFYAFGNGYFFAALTNIVILLYAYTWFDLTLIWECSMLIATILMLIISTFAFTYDYYHEHDYVVELNIQNYLPYDTESFAISAGLTTTSIMILVLDFMLLISEIEGTLLARIRKRISRRLTIFAS